MIVSASSHRSITDYTRLCCKSTCWPHPSLYNPPDPTNTYVTQFLNRQKTTSSWSDTAVTYQNRPKVVSLDRPWARHQAPGILKKITLPFSSYSFESSHSLSMYCSVRILLFQHKCGLQTSTHILDYTFHILKNYCYLLRPNYPCVLLVGKRQIMVRL